MPSAGPDWLLPILATTAVFAVMFHLGIGTTPAEYGAAWRSPWLMLKGIFASLVAVPVVAIVVARAFALPREAEIGLVLMAISPGAPIALKRALGAGADRSFAATLQVATAMLAAASMPLWIMALDEVYAGSAVVAPWRLASQVLVGQLLPLALGMGARRLLGPRLSTVEPLLANCAAALLAALLVVVVLEVWRPVAGAGLRVVLAIAVAALCATAVGHALGGPQGPTRTAFAVTCGARNVGLALLVASINNASPRVMGAILAYLLVSALAMTPYVAWRARSQAAPQNTSLP
ncbi:MAG: bile acid:sodium symporter family protein [Usitatibacter sp.]